MCGYFDVQDFFTAGLGCDIGGAYLLGRGLIGRPADLARLSGSFYGSNAYQAVSLARDRIDAISGFGALALGFFLQAVGYLGGLAGWGDETTSSGEAVVGGAFLVIALAAVVLLGRLHLRLRHKRTLVEMSRYIMDGTRMEYPRAALLPHFARALGYEQLAGESELDFCRRTMGVTDLTVDVVGGSTSRASEMPPTDETA